MKVLSSDDSGAAVSKARLAYDTLSGAMNTDEKNCCLKATQLTCVEMFFDFAPSLMPSSSIEVSSGKRYESVVYMFSFWKPFSFWKVVFAQSI